MPEQRTYPGYAPGKARPGLASLALLFCLPGLVLAAVPGLPAMLGGANSPFVPLPEIPGLFILALLLGFFGGSVAAAGGACGSFLAVPALMGLGLRGVFAAGSELLALCLFGLLGGLDHFRSNKLHSRLALWLALGSLAGAAGGGLLSLRLFLDDPDRSDLYMAGTQALLLALLCALAIRDLVRFLRGGPVKKAPRRADEEPRRGKERNGAPKTARATAEAAPRPPSGFLALLAWLLPFGPLRDLGKGKPADAKAPGGPGRRGDRDREPEASGAALEAEASGPSGFLALAHDPADPAKGAVSALPALALGLASGFFLAFAGSSGGALTLPLLSGVLGFAAIPAAGADLLQTGLAAGLGAALLAPAGLLLYTVAAGLLLGLLSGLRLSRPVIRFINPVNLKSFFLAVTLAVFLNRLLTLPLILEDCGLLRLPPALDEALHSAAGFLVFMVPLAFALWVLITLFSNLAALRQGTGARGPQARPLLLSALCTVLTLAVLWAMAVLPLSEDRNLMDSVDAALLSRLKGQGPRGQDLEQRLRALDGTTLRLTLAFPDQRQADIAAALVTDYGYNVAPAGNRVQVPYLDARAFAVQTLRDARAIYSRDGRAVAMNLGLPEQETLLLLWNLCRTLGTELERVKRPEAAALYARLRAEVLEPAYNLAGVQPLSGSGGWPWFLAGFATLLALGLLWRAGGNLLLTGLGVAFLRDPAPQAPPSADDAPQPRPQARPGPPAARKPAK